MTLILNRNQTLKLLKSMRGKYLRNFGKKIRYRSWVYTFGENPPKIKHLTFIKK